MTSDLAAMYIKLLLEIRRVRGASGPTVHVDAWVEEQPKTAAAEMERLAQRIDEALCAGESETRALVKELLLDEGHGAEFASTEAGKGKLTKIRKWLKAQAKAAREVAAKMERLGTQGGPITRTLAPYNIVRLLYAGEEPPPAVAHFLERFRPPRRSDRETARGREGAGEVDRDEFLEMLAQATHRLCDWMVQEGNTPWDDLGSRIPESNEELDCLVQRLRDLCVGTHPELGGLIEEQCRSMPVEQEPLGEIEAEIYERLRGAILTLEEIEIQTERARHTVVKYLKTLIGRRLVKQRKGGGYYRPDAVPAENRPT